MRRPSAALQEQLDVSPVLNHMYQMRIPLTRENYLDLTYMGNPPELDAEGESEIPEFVRNRLNRKRRGHAKAKAKAKA